jgi:hypothetical protein
MQSVAETCGISTWHLAFRKHRGGTVLPGVLTGQLCARQGHFARFSVEVVPPEATSKCSCGLRPDQVVSIARSLKYANWKKEVEA